MRTAHVALKITHSINCSSMKSQVAFDNMSGFKAKGTIIVIQKQRAV